MCKFKLEYLSLERKFLPSLKFVDYSSTPKCAPLTKAPLNISQKKFAKDKH